jgi:hypothetical protein
LSLCLSFSLWVRDFSSSILSISFFLFFLLYLTVS